MDIPLLTLLELVNLLMLQQHSNSPRFEGEKAIKFLLLPADHKKSHSYS